MIPGIYRMSPRRFRKAIEAGVFGERHVELLGGIPLHYVRESATYLRFDPSRVLAKCFAPVPLWVVNKEHRLELGQWLPLADAVVLEGPDTIYGTRLARADDVALLVEIADTSYAKDSGPKLRRYATYRIPVYWIVDLKRRIVEVRYQPFGKGKQAGYARCETYLEHDHVPVVLAGNEVGRIAVAQLLP